MIHSQTPSHSDRNHLTDVTTLRIPNNNSRYLDNGTLQDGSSVCLSDDDSDGEGLDAIIRELDPKHGGVSSPNSDGVSQCSAGSTRHQTVTTIHKANEDSKASVSHRDSLLSPSTRALHQSQTPRPKRSDFGDYYPDGGWGWVVCGAMFMVQFLAQGIHLAAGTLTMDIIAEFKTGESYAVWMCSVSYGISSMLSPVVIIICSRKSPRLLALVGGLLTSLACLVMSFSRMGHQLFVAVGLVLPLGTGLSLSTSSLMLGRYFRKRRECAEMLALCGSGAGMAVVSVFQAQLFSMLSWMRTMQAVAGLMVPTLLAGAVLRSPTIYHPRRKVILHLKTLNKTKKQRQDFENKPPYFDFSPLGMRSVQVLLISTFVTNMGAHVPFLLLPGAAEFDEIPEPSYNLIMVFLGVAFAFGCLVFGLIVVRSNVRCMISRQYLVQLTSVGCGAVTLLFSLAHHFDGYALYVWAYGLCYGGYVYTVRMYMYELVTIKLSERTAVYVMFVQGLPAIFSIPFARWLNDAFGGPADRYGFMFSGVSMLLGAAILLLMPWASKHPSNWETIQAAHLHTDIPDDVMLFDMNVSEDTASKMSKQNNVCTKLYDKLNGNGINGDNIQSHTGQLSVLGPSDEEPWSHIESMSPMSSTDKVTEFLMHSQNMLQNFSRIHHMGLSDVKLEINNQYPSESDLVDTTDEIRDLTLQATVCRNSPYKRGAKSRSNPTDSDILTTCTDPQIHHERSPDDIEHTQVQLCQTFDTFQVQSKDDDLEDDITHSNRPREITTTV